MRELGETRQLLNKRWQFGDQNDLLLVRLFAGLLTMNRVMMTEQEHNISPRPRKDRLDQGQGGRVETSVPSG